MAAQVHVKQMGRPVIPVLLLLWFASLSCLAQTGDSERLEPRSCCDACYQGQAGTPGVPGIPGVPGNSGIQGATGPKGELGLGSPGLKGDKGVQGLKGDPGNPGVHGLPGKIGPSGSIGESGQKGRKGESGETTHYTPTPPSAVGFTAFLTADVQISIDEAIVFDDVTTNIGNGYDSQSGNFTCSIPGAYFFTSTVILSDTYYSFPVYVKLKKNDDFIVTVFSQDNRHYYASNSAVVTLETGDRVWLEVCGDRYSRYLSDRLIRVNGANKHTSFAGFLISSV